MSKNGHSFENTSVIDGMQATYCFEVMMTRYEIVSCLLRYGTVGWLFKGSELEMFS